MPIGERIKKLRLKNNFTLDEIAEKLGTSRQTIFKYENNIVTNIPSDKIEKLAFIFDVSPAYIMGWENESLGNHFENIDYLKDKPELLELYKEIVANDQLVLLFDKARKLSPQDLEQVLKIIDTFNKETMWLYGFWRLFKVS